MDEELKESQAQKESALAQAAAEKLRADAAVKTAEAATLRADTAEGEKAGLQTRLDTLAEETKDVDIDKLKEENTNLKVLLTAETVRADAAESDEVIDKLVNDRVAARTAVTVRASAIMVKDKEFMARLDSMSNREIQEAVVTRLDGPVAEGAADAYIAGQFDTLTKGFEQANVALAKVTQKAADDAGKRTDGEPEQRKDADAIRQKFEDSQNNLAKTIYSTVGAS